MNNDIKDYYGFGWAFYKSSGTAFKDEVHTGNSEELKQWCLGFLAGMAEYPEFPSFKKALIGLNVDCRIINNLCKLADEAINESNEFIRLPSVPIL